MNRKYLFLGLILMGVLVMSISFASASLCQNSRGYYEDCDSGRNSKSKYKTFNTADYDKPTFKGSYGNYRYDMYKNGDYNPEGWFQPRKTYSGYDSGGPYFSGGYGGGYNSYRSYGYGGLSYYNPSYSYGYYDSYPSFYSYFWY